MIVIYVAAFLAGASAAHPWSDKSSPDPAASEVATNGPKWATEKSPPRKAKIHERHEDDEPIVVTGEKGASADILGGVSVLDAGELTHDMKPGLGDLLADMPGVSASSFAPSSSRPILRGEQGERAPVLVDGISSLDLSSSDPDHAVTINPLTAQRIEVLHGPGALLYAPSAIGGVVNVIDSRIPRGVPQEVDGDLLLNYGTAAKERSGNLGIDVPLGGHFVAHADGAYSKYDDLHIGGHVLGDRLRKQALASPDPDVRGLADLKGSLPNSAGRIDDLAGGLAYVDGDLDIGFSYNHHDARYGIPIRFSLDPAVEPERPTIDAHQDRGDVRVNMPIGGFFRIFEFRGGLSKYRHNELEADGTVGSRFYLNGGEFRADVVQDERAGWGGTSGIEYLDQNGRIRGDEKYLPDNHRKNVGFFTLQSFQSGKVAFEAAGRIDRAKLRASEDERIAEIVEETGEDSDVGDVPVSRSFTAFSGSVGANYELLEGWQAGLSLSHSERAPGVDELFSFGPHGGSEQFLIGNPDLRLEKSNGVEFSIHRTKGAVRVQGSIYYSHFSNFIFQVPTGEIEDNNLPVYEYRQGKANYYGF
jgi:iron complex outermembrane receptor protein